MIAHKSVVVVLSFLGCLLAVSTAAHAVDEPDWPRVIVVPEGTLTIYQPQLDSWKQDQVTARAAISVQLKASEQLQFGAAWLEARVSVDRDERTATFSEMKVSRVRFADAPGQAEEKVKQIIMDSMRAWNPTVSLDRLLAMLQYAQREQKSAAALKKDPPKIIVAHEPAVLVLLDGEPRLLNVEGSTLQRVANTPFFIVWDQDRKAFFLTGAGFWYTAASINGPWNVTEDVPQGAKQMAAAAESGAPTTSPASVAEAAPKILVSLEPAELVFVDGPAQLQVISGTDLLYVANSDSDIFVDTNAQQIFLLLSGRWFTASSKTGPWTPVASDQLPEDFKRIPPGHERAYVLASVAGTKEAQDAVLDAAIPQTAVVKRSEATASVTYDGEPRFEPIEGTSMQYAVNTSSSVILCNGKYYCCENGVWFVSDTPNGPWAVCDSVPPEIYTIPPSCPAYNTSYVYVYESDPELVHVGYYPGYTGCYVYGPTVVYGTGYDYHGWYGQLYYPRPVTYGFAAAYNPYTGNWGYRVGAVGPGGWFVAGGAYGGTYWGGAAIGGWWGAGGRRPWGAGSAEVERNLQTRWGTVSIDTQAKWAPGSVDIDRTVTGPRGGQVQSSWEAHRNWNGSIDVDRDREVFPPQNLYQRRQDIAAKDRQGQWTTARQNWAADGARRSVQPQLPADRTRVQPSPTIQRSQPTTPGNNVLVDRDGNVYRRSLEGWEQRQNNSWQRPASTPRAQPQPVNRPSQNRSQLDRDYAARSYGAQRSQSYQQRSASRSPSYRSPAARPVGRGGGGRR